MKRLFGGYIVYTEHGSAAEYIGVWSVRMASRFRRVLRERGAAFHRLPGFPPGLQVKAMAIRQHSA